MNKISTYFRESYHELTEKVTWPTWVQLQQSTMIVLDSYNYYYCFGLDYGLCFSKFIKAYLLFI